MDQGDAEKVTSLWAYFSLKYVLLNFQFNKDFCCSAHLLSFIYTLCICEYVYI